MLWEAHTRRVEFAVLISKMNLENGGDLMSSVDEAQQWSSVVSNIFKTKDNTLSGESLSRVRLPSPPLKGLNTKIKCLYYV